MSFEQAKSGQCTLTSVPVLTSRGRLRRVADLRLLAELVDGEVDPMPLALRGDLHRAVLPSSTNGIASSVFSALPWAPRVGRDVGFAARDARGEVEDAFDRPAGMPGPLSRTVIPARIDRTSISGAMPASSQASSALSTSSFTTTSGQRRADGRSGPSAPCGCRIEQPARAEGRALEDRAHGVASWHGCGALASAPSPAASRSGRRRVAPLCAAWAVRLPGGQKSPARIRSALCSAAAQPTYSEPRAAPPSPGAGRCRGWPNAPASAPTSSKSLQFHGE